MNKNDVIDLLVNTTVSEFCKPGNREFLTEIVRNGFPGFMKMSDHRLEQELVFWGIKDCLADDDHLETDESLDSEEFGMATIRLED